MAGVSCRVEADIRIFVVLLVTRPTTFAKLVYTFEL
jgi:hypothetical protein